jgi:hypothetical protein
VDAQGLRLWRSGGRRSSGRVGLARDWTGRALFGRGGDIVTVGHRLEDPGTAGAGLLMTWEGDETSMAAVMVVVPLES